MRDKEFGTARKREIFSRRFLGSLVALLVLVLIQACAPRRASRSSFPSPRISPPPRAPGSRTKPVVQGRKIKEQDLKENRSVPPQARVRDRRALSTLGRERLPPLPGDSLIAKITPRTSPRRAVSLRFTEEGKRLLEAGEYARALGRLEKTIAVDSTNGYGYYYLAQTHYHMGRYRESLNFLDVAESLFTGETYWLAKVFALKGESFRALGIFRRAGSSYSQALRLNPGNQLASEGLSRMRGRTQPSLR
ncbi:MAG: tetratricopeptide repeat protein [Deltaproteobacteria bacterium]|nr:tetratricopeptide repeat protein [Deltaproteobacteria bacterium]